MGLKWDALVLRLAIERPTRVSGYTRIVDGHVQHVGSYIARRKQGIGGPPHYGPASAATSTTDYTKVSTPALKKMIKARGGKHYFNMNRAELREWLSAHDSNDAARKLQIENQARARFKEWTSTSDKPSAKRTRTATKPKVMPKPKPAKPEPKPVAAKSESVKKEQSGFDNMPEDWGSFVEEYKKRAATGAKVYTAEEAIELGKHVTAEIERRKALAEGYPGKEEVDQALTRYKSASMKESAIYSYRARASAHTSIGGENLDGEYVSWTEAQWAKEDKKAYELRNKAKSEYDALVDKYAPAKQKSLSAFYQDVMSELRPMADPDEFMNKTYSNDEASVFRKKLRKAIAFYPRDWAHMIGSLYVDIMPKIRPYQTHGSIHMSDRSPAESYAHEVGHQMEEDVRGWNPETKRFEGLSTLEGSLLKMRRDPGSPVPLSTLKGGKQYGPDELAFTDHWRDPYMGKYYRDNHYELFTCAIEDLVAGGKKFKLFDKDREMFDWLMGVLAGL